ncbi:MAG: glycosyltransferase, partial [Deltaproteobacteria bacterium]|nr:glycosyltransferase [Deltaproteobacteria bacterium]
MLDIIIINFNSTDCLLKCIESIYNTLPELPVNLHVYDNASTDNVERINMMFPEVRLIKNNWNMGFAKAINKGLKQSDGLYALLLNPDTVVQDGFFECLIEFMEDNPDAAVIGPKILDHDGTVQGSARSFPTPLTGLFGRSSFLSKNFPNNRFTLANILTTRSDGTTPMEVDWVSGACMLVRRDALKDVGLMDERFFMYWEDADWCKRMWEKNWKVIYLPEASVIHYVGVSSEKLIVRSILEFHKSSYRLFEKYRMPCLWVLKPLVIAGLSIRIPFAIASSWIRGLSLRTAYPAIRKEASPAYGKQRRINVLRMIARLNIGGPSIHVNLLTKGLDASRFHSILVTGNISPQEGDMSYLFDSSDSKPIIITELQREISLNLDIKAIIHIFKILHRENPDIVHTHTAKAGFGARMAVILYNILCRKKVRMVHTFHGHIFEGYFSRQKSLLFIWVERLLAKYTDVIIAISPTQKRELG